MSYIIFDFILDNQINEVRDFLSQGNDVNTVIFGESLLYRSVMLRRKEIVELLLSDPNIDVNLEKENGFTPLLLSIHMKSFDIAKLLLGHPKIDVNKADAQKTWTPISFVYTLIKSAVLLDTKQEYLNLFKLLLSNPEFNFSDTTKYDTSILHMICEDRESDMLSLVLQYPKIDINIKNKFDITPIFKLTQSSSSRNKKNITDMLNLLLHRPEIDLNVYDKSGKSFLFYSENQIIIYVLNHSSKKIDVNYMITKNNSILKNACINNNLELVKELFNYPELKNTTDYKLMQNEYHESIKQIVLKKFKKEPMQKINSMLNQIQV
jgi:ankyrin repeat protein